MRRCGLRLGFLNFGWNSGRNDSGHGSGDSKTFQDIASAHAFIVSHEILREMRLYDAALQ
ncbi:hypothetical protein GCM10007857_55680 [Bradyrhizobium iriomotense]|uniref:Uncharacterized protein n=1 Tax=Bradyrhizobium iriomotense TaxID=441950 RepID=A0ABQ6B7E2_9BRAD|nr:hypothetical protein GCM10007857_55680 [Bradyrhizobium iriomotense]